MWGGDLHVVHGTTLETDQVVVMAGEPLRQLVACQPLRGQMVGHHSGVLQSRQRSIERGQRNPTTQPIGQLGGRHWPGGPCQLPHDGATPAGEADTVFEEPELHLTLQRRHGHRKSIMIMILIRMRTILMVVAIALALTGLASCASDDVGADEGLLVVATTSIWGDVASQVLGDHGRVETLIPSGVDSHDYQPSPRAIALLRDADLVVANGLGLEEGMEDVLAGAAGDGVDVLEIAPLLDPLPLTLDGQPPRTDPHVWLDPVRVADAARLLADRLGAVEPSVDWASSAEDYAERLRSAHEEIADRLAAVPAQARRLVSNHESLGYLAQRYDFEVLAVVIPGGSTLAEPSSQHLADLVALIEEEGVKAIFTETTHSARLAEAVAAEAGDVPVVELYVEALGDPGSGASTLVDMLVLNAEVMADALTR